MGERRSEKLCLSTSTTSTSTSTPTPWVPMDIVATHILPRLPARSLVQYKSVCKEFCSLISSSQFINLHSHFHPASSHRLLLLLLVTPPGKDPDLDQCNLYSLAFDKPQPHHLPLPKTLCARRKGKLLDDHSIYVVGSCNGLVCLGFPWSDVRSWGQDFMFLNPLTGMFTSETSLVRPGGRNDGLSSTSFGFGYDAINDDYKVVHVTNYLWNIARQRSREVFVYSIKSDSWKLVEAETKQNSYLACLGSGVLVHNHLLHWLFYYADMDTDTDMFTSRTIVCFDVETEQWVANVPLPDHVHGQLTSSPDATLGILDGCFSLTLNIHGKDQTDVWIMKEYGVKESWTKLFSITPHLPKHFKMPSNALAFGYWTGSSTTSTRKQVLLNLEWPQLGIEGCFWYDLESKTTNKFEINGVSSPPTFTALTMCLESLAPVFQGSHLSNAS